MNKLKVVYYMKEYATNKKIKDLLMKINPLLTRKVNNIRIHIESLKNGILSEEECKTIEAKMELGKLCLRLEEMNPNSFATLLFYVEEENKIYHGAAPNIPLHNFEFFHEINKKQLFHEMICGRAVLKGDVVFSDIFSDPTCIHERDISKDRGFQSVWSIPFNQGGSTIGTFAMFQRHKKRSTKTQIHQAKQKVLEFQESINLLSEN